MTSAGELIRRLARGEEVPVALVTEADPVELGEIVARCLTWPRVPDAAAMLGPAPRHHDPIAAPRNVRARNVRVVVGSLPPPVFAWMVAVRDPRAVDHAANVDVLGVAYLVIRAMDAVAVDDPVAVLDQWIIADRQRMLGESW